MGDVEPMEGSGLTRMMNLTDAQKQVVYEARDKLMELMNNAMTNSSWWNQSVSTEPGTFTLKLIKDAARQLQAGRSLHSTGSFHASKSKVKVVPRCDRFGTDFTTVDRMANPYRPGTVPHKDWMMAWVDAQYHWKTDRYQQHHAEVTEAREAMIESCAPVANWVDEVLFEVAEAREECESVDYDDGVRCWLDEVDWDEAIITEPFDVLGMETSVQVVDNWHLRMIVRAPLPTDSIINISVV